MGEKKLPTEKIKRISLDQAVELSEGYITNPGSIRNLICRGRIKRYGPPKQIELDYFEWMEYLGRPLE